MRIFALACAIALAAAPAQAQSTFGGMNGNQSFGGTFWPTPYGGIYGGMDGNQSFGGTVWNSPNPGMGWGDVTDDPSILDLPF